MKPGSLPTDTTATTLRELISRILTIARPRTGDEQERLRGRHGPRSVPDQHRFRHFRRVIRIDDHHGVHAFAGDEQLAAIGIEAQVIGPHGQRQMRDQGDEAPLDGDRS